MPVRLGKWCSIERRCLVSRQTRHEFLREVRRFEPRSALMENSLESDEQPEGREGPQ